MKHANNSRLIKQQETERAFAEKPISNEDLRALFNHLEEVLFEEREDSAPANCDHTLTKFRAFLQQRGLNNIDEICEWFEEYGGYCDCEVAYNVTDFWDDILSVSNKSVVPKRHKISAAVCGNSTPQQITPH